jgi:hypothetical protein
MALSGQDQQDRGGRLLSLGDRAAGGHMLEGEEMKCMQCGMAMTSARENFNYKASGLPVTLLNIEVRRVRRVRGGHSKD